MPVITLPDGSKKVFEKSVTVLEIAQSIGAGLAKATIAGKVNDVLLDATLPIEKDAEVVIITSKDKEGVEIIRHSFAHLIGHAVKQIYPNIKMAIGPVIEDGFYYDIFSEYRFTPEDLIKIEKKIYAPHRVKPFEIEIWKNNKTNFDKELIIFMPGLGGEINNFKWIGNELARRGWPILFIDHRGSNLESFIEVLDGKETIPGSADFFLYRIKDLEAVLKAHENGEFGLPNNSYILMGHSLGALIALLYEGKKPTYQLEEKCDSALKDFALTNLSKLLQCQLSEIPFPKKNNTNKASAIVGFNSFGSLVWPKENSTGIKAPTLLIGGTYDLITPLINEQFRVFYALNNPSNRFLIIEGASHFSPIRINKSYEENNDLFKISESFIGSEPILVQDLSTKFIVEFLKNIKDQKIPNVVKNQRDLGLNFHLLDLETIKEISEN